MSESVTNEQIFICSIKIPLEQWHLPDGLTMAVSLFDNKQRSKQFEHCLNMAINKISSKSEIWTCHVDCNDVTFICRFSNREDIELKTFSEIIKKGLLPAITKIKFNNKDIVLNKFEFEANVRISFNIQLQPYNK